MRALHWLPLLSVLWMPLLHAQEPAGSAVAEGGILDETVTGDADIERLKAEAKLLDTIGKGLALSLAQCTGVENCELTVNRAELKQLMATVEQRINGLVQRQSAGEAAVDDLLVAYASVRDTYTQQLGKLGEIAPEAGADAAADEGDAFDAGIPAEGAAESAAAPEEFSIFEDVDESLTDEPAGDEGAEPDTQQ